MKILLAAIAITALAIACFVAGRVTAPPAPDQFHVIPFRPSEYGFIMLNATTGEIAWSNSLPWKLAPAIQAFQAGVADRKTKAHHP